MDDGARNIEQAMETTTAFDLNHEIARWRQTLGQSPAVRADNLEELEAHLRDTVEGLEGKGLSTEEAFVLASRRLGPAKPIEAEFAKVNPGGIWLHRVLWMLIGVQAWALIGGVSRLVADAALFGGATVAGPEFIPTSLTIPSLILPGGLFLAVQLLTIVALIGLAWLFLRSSDRAATSTSRRVVRTPLLVLLVLGGGLAILGVYASNSMLLPMVFRNLLRLEHFGALSYSKSLASMILFLIQTATMAGLTVILTMRLFGSKRTVKVGMQ